MENDEYLARAPPSIKRDLLAVKETYDIGKRDLLQRQKRPDTHDNTGLGLLTLVVSRPPTAAWSGSEEVCVWAWVWVWVWVSWVCTYISVYL